MGLDQYIEVKEPSSDTYIEHMYFRKFNELQGWFEREHNQENCGSTPMTREVILALLSAIENDELVRTEGFFYGNIEASKEQISELVDELNDMLVNIDDGYEYRYYCWY